MTAVHAVLAILCLVPAFRGAGAACCDSVCGSDAICGGQCVGGVVQCECAGPCSGSYTQCIPNACGGSPSGGGGGSGFCLYGSACNCIGGRVGDLCTLTFVAIVAVLLLGVLPCCLCCFCSACCAGCPCNKHHDTTVVVSNNQNISTQQAPYTTLPGGAGPQQQYVPPQPAQPFGSAYAPGAQQYVPPQRICDYDGRCHRQAPDHWVKFVHKLQDGPVDAPKRGAAPV